MKNEVFLELRDYIFFLISVDDIPGVLPTVHFFCHFRFTLVLLTDSAMTLFDYYKVCRILSACQKSIGTLTSASDRSDIDAKRCYGK